MIKIIGNDVYRGGEKIGWLEGNDILDHEGKKRGHFSENDVYGSGGQKLGYVEGDYFKSMDGRDISLPETMRHVEGGNSKLEKLAVKLLLDDKFST